MDKIEKLVVKVLKNLVPKSFLKNANKETHLVTDLGMDSIQMLAFSIKLCEEFKLDLKEILEKVDLSQIKTISDVVNVVDKYIP